MFGVFLRESDFNSAPPSHLFPLSLSFSDSVSPQKAILEFEHKCFLFFLHDYISHFVGNVGTLGRAIHITLSATLATQFSLL